MMTETIQQLKEDIAVLQEKLQKLEEIEKQPRINLQQEGEYAVVSYHDKVFYRLGNKTTFSWWRKEKNRDMARPWILIMISDAETERLLEGLYYNHIQVKKEKEQRTNSPVLEAYKDWWGQYPETGDWDATDDARWLGFRAGYHMAYQEKVTEWEPTPQTPDETEQGLRNAFKTAKEDGVFDDSLSDTKQRILHQSKQLAAYMEKQSQPLWRRIGGNTGPYDLGPAEIANILNLIADEVEHRGVIDYDRDPGETAEWLRHEAQKAVSEIES